MEAKAETFPFFNFVSMYRLLFFLIPLPFFAVCLVMISLDGIFDNIEPEKTDRQTLVRIMQLRDFSRLAPDLIERLTSRAEQEFGRHSPNKPVFAISFLEKKIHVYFQTHRSNQRSCLERNLTLMARVRYFQWMYEHQTAASARKAALMNDVVADMRYWQEVYLDYVRSLGQPEPTLAELYQDFQRMIEEFKIGATSEEVVQIDSFAQSMSRALFATEVQRSIFNFFAPQN